MAEILTIVGLFFDIVGVFLLFCFAPEKDPNPQIRAGFRIADRIRNEWLKHQSRRHVVAWFSVILIVFGFGMQLAGEVIAAGGLDRILASLQTR